MGGRAALQPTALPAISITQGANSANNKAAFIKAAFAELRHQLAADGVLADASDVMARDLPATDWGYGGRTQQARRQAQPGCVWWRVKCAYRESAARPGG